MIVTSDKEEREAKAHYLYVGQCVLTRDELQISAANRYMDHLMADNRDMYDLVMKMLEFTFGVNWAAIRNSRS